MKAFLEDVAQYVIDNHNEDLDKVTIIFPNKRASLFFKKYLSNLVNKTFWAPNLLSIEEFVENLVELKVVDATHLLLQFYDIHKSIEKENSQTLDEFTRWAQQLLHDFNEIDLHLIHSKKFFNFINENRALEVWNLNQSEITEFQKQYLDFWKKMDVYYHQLRDKLHSLNIAYQGMAYRQAAENATSLSKSIHNPLIFAGFNALTEAEEIIITHLVSEKKAVTLWDSDSYYTENKSQEAGVFLRKHKVNPLFSNNKTFMWDNNHFNTSHKQVQIHGVSGNINMVKFASNLLQSMANEHTLTNTALVLANENLLVPVLQSLPDNIANINVTMGYPLKNSPFFDFFELCLVLQENAFKKNGMYYYNDLIKVITHPTIALNHNITVKLSRFVSIITLKNKIYISAAEFIRFLDQANDSLTAYILPLFIHWENNPQKCIASFLQFIDGYLIAQKELKHSIDKQLENEFLYEFTKEFKKLTLLIEKHKSISELKTLKKFLKQIIQQKTLPFYGEPLSGLQIMGVLETRTIDFENIILLSANEDILPTGKTYNSFIPFEIKKAFKLPAYYEKDAIFAYHFYRLLQRSKNVHILYNTEAGGFTNPDKSRYVTQIVHELPKYNTHISINEHIAHLPVAVAKKTKTEIAKNKSVIDSIKKYLQKGTSASALNTYKNCPLDFYYKYILRLKEIENVEEIIEASTYGSYLHKTLENLYKPHENKVLKVSDIDTITAKSEQELYSSFTADYTKEDLASGENLLLFTLAKKQLSHFLSKEKELLNKLSKTGQSLTYVSSEINLKKEISLSDFSFIVNGQIDRIDRIGNTVRIIDYKTGKVESKNVMLKSINGIFQEKETDKAIQLLTYLYLTNELPSVINFENTAGIVSFKALNQGFIPLKIEKETKITSTDLEVFEQEIKLLITDMLNTNQPFEHNKDAKYCSFCN